MAYVPSGKCEAMRLVASQLESNYYRQIAGLSAIPVADRSTSVMVNGTGLIKEIPMSRYWFEEAEARRTVANHDPRTARIGDTMNFQKAKSLLNAAADKREAEERAERIDRYYP